MRVHRYLRLFAPGLATFLIALNIAYVDATSADISHAYHASSNITSGSLVSLDKSKSNYVEPANTSNSNQLVGVAVEQNSSLLVLDPSSGTLQVAISGSVNVIASTINGNISVGDQISASPISGVGMKSLPGSRVIGNAQSSLNSNTQAVNTQKIADKNGNKTEVKVGFVKINVAVGTAPSNDLSGLNVVERFAANIAGHPVSVIKVFLSVAVALFALVALSVLIYGAIHSSIIAVGRNPLAHNTVFKTLVSALGMAIITAGLACVAIFVLLH